MGLEAVCRCSIDDVSADAKVLLEAGELILRAPFRRSLPISDLRDIKTAGGELRFSVGSCAVSLQLGPEIAEKWAKRIASPPPSLAQKLGIGHRSPAYLIGEIDEPVLLDVLDGHTAGPGTAKLSLAVIHDAEHLSQVVSLHEAAMGEAPIWLVYGKGRSATVGEMLVRQTMRARGYRDTKVSAVSATLTAARYSPG